MKSKLLKDRKANRLKDYDYSKDGYYFVTICTQDREEYFGTIDNEDMILNDAGKMVLKIWNQIPIFYKGIEIDIFQIMPNHIHGIIIINHTSNIVQIDPSVCPQTVDACSSLSLSDITQRFKTMTTKQYTDGVKQKGWKSYNKKLWQRSFYDHILRDNESLNNVRKYITENPLKWDSDENNLNSISNTK